MKHAGTEIRIRQTPGKPDRFSVARVDKANKVVEWLLTPGKSPQTTASREHAEYLARRFAVKGNEKWFGPRGY